MTEMRAAAARPATADAGTTEPLLRAYKGAGDAWAAGPGPAYERLAALAVAALPRPLAGALVLDLGAGTGAASRCVARAGGRPVALDPAPGMLRRALADHRDASPHRLPAAGGDAGRLPFRARSLDGAVAAFCLSHLRRPDVALREVCRVLRPDGACVAATFRREPPHPAKERVDRVAAAFGFRPPAWHERAKAFELATSEPEALARCAAAAGLRDVRVEVVRADTGVDTAAALVRWRLGMAHLAPFVAALPPAVRARLAAAAEAAVGPAPQPWRPAVLILSSRAPA
jgi:SAM-dependent methyltransferase